MEPLRQMRSLRKVASIHASVFNHFNQDRGYIHRAYFEQSRVADLAKTGMCMYSSGCASKYLLTAGFAAPF